MRNLVLVAALLASGAAFAEGTGAKVDMKVAKAECQADAKKANKKLSKDEVKECVKNKMQH